MKTYYGIDLGVKSSTYCLVDEQGEVVDEGEVTMDKECLKRVFGSKEPMPMVVEACPMAEWVCQYLEELGHEAVIIDARQAKAVIHSKRKTDKIDAKKLAQICRTGWYNPVHRKSTSARELRSKHTARKGLISTQKGLSNRIRGIFRLYGVQVGKVAQGGFYERVTSLLERVPEGLTDSLSALLRVWDETTKELHELTKRLEREVKQDKLCRHLMTVDGVGPITASTFIATIDDPGRFDNGDQVASYLGLVPREYQSGETHFRGRITKEGDQLLRSLLVEAATALLSRVKRRSNLKDWGQHLQKGKGFGKARVAVARKLACLLWAMWTSGKSFEPQWVRPVITEE
jgi:transposase